MMMIPMEMAFQIIKIRMMTMITYLPVKNWPIIFLIMMNQEIPTMIISQIMLI